MSKELCARTLTSSQMARITAAFPNIDWSGLFALIQRDGSSIIQVVDDLASFMSAPTVAGLLDFIKKDGGTLVKVVDDLIAVLHPGA